MSVNDFYPAQEFYVPLTAGQSVVEVPKLPNDVMPISTLIELQDLLHPGFDEEGWPLPQSTEQVLGRVESHIDPVYAQAADLNRQFFVENSDDEETGMDADDHNAILKNNVDARDKFARSLGKWTVQIELIRLRDALIESMMADPMGYDTMALDRHLISRMGADPIAFMKSVKATREAA